MTIFGGVHFFMHDSKKITSDSLLGFQNFPWATLKYEYANLRKIEFIEILKKLSYKVRKSRKFGNVQKNVKS